jgi:hypothetical protein
MRAIGIIDDPWLVTKADIFGRRPGTPGFALEEPMVPILEWEAWLIRGFYSR